MDVTENVFCKINDMSENIKIKLETTRFFFKLKFYFFLKKKNFKTKNKMLL
jgi:hypothetical protein